MSEEGVKDMPVEQEDGVIKKEISEEFLVIDDGNTDTTDPIITQEEEQDMKSDGARHEDSENYHDTHEELNQDEGNVSKEEPEECEDDKHGSGEEDADMEADDKSDTLQGESFTIQEMVNQALESKLGGFEAQLQQMMSAFQNAAGKEGADNGDRAEEAPLNESKDDTLEDVPLNESKDDTLEDVAEKTVDDTHEDVEPMEAAQTQEEIKNTEEKKEKLDETEEKWREFLGEVSSILDLETDSEKSDLDKTMTQEGRKSVRCLPADETIKEQWRKVNEGRSKDNTKEMKKLRFHYFWPSEDIDNYGRVPTVNDDIVKHIRRMEGTAGKYNVFSDQFSKTLDQDIRKLDFYLRSQQKVISYASYFLAALSKTVKAQLDTENKFVSEISEHMENCLNDACNMSVQASVIATQARRKMHLHALKIGRGQTVSHMINMPVTSQLFPGDIKNTLKKHGIQLQTQKSGKSGNTTPSGNRGGPFRGNTRSGGQGLAQGSQQGRGSHPSGGGWSNINRDNNRREGPQQADKRRRVDESRKSNDSGGRGRGGKRRPSGGAGAKRKRGNSFSSPGRNTSNRFDLQYPSYSMQHPDGMGHSGIPRGMEGDRLQGNPGLYNSTKGYAGYGNAMDGGNRSLYPSSGGRGEGYYRPGDTSSFLGYMSFSDGGSTLPPVATDVYHGNVDHMYL